MCSDVHSTSNEPDDFTAYLLRGRKCVNRAYIDIGVRFAGARVRSVEQGELVHVYCGAPGGVGVGVTRFR
jgi:hypothetical protein